MWYRQYTNLGGQNTVILYKQQTFLNDSDLESERKRWGREKDGEGDKKTHLEFSIHLNAYEYKLLMRNTHHFKKPG